MARRDSRATKPQLRFDKVALRLVQDVRAAVEGAVPDGLCVLFTVTAPIREPSKTVASLVEIIRTQLLPGQLSAEHAAALHGNQVRLRVVAGRSHHALRVAGFIHNPDPPPTGLLDLAQSLSGCVDPPDLTWSSGKEPDLDTLRRVCAQVLDAEGCAKVLAAAGAQRARPTRS